MRILHMTIGISEPRPADEKMIALAWVALILMLIAIFVVGLFGIG